MKNISPLNNIHQIGKYGDFQNVKDHQIIKIKEIKNIFIYQLVKFKNSSKKNSDLSIQSLSFPNILEVNAKNDLRILWMGPNNWLIFSSKNIYEELNKNFSMNEFAVTDISHSRSIIELEGLNVKEVLKKGSPFDIESLKQNNCTNTIYNGITITVDCVDQDLNKIRIISLRSFGESLYHSIADGCLEYGYEGT